MCDKAADEKEIKVDYVLSEATVKELSEVASRFECGLKVEVGLGTSVVALATTALHWSTL